MNDEESKIVVSFYAIVLVFVANMALLGESLAVELLREPGDKKNSITTGCGVENGNSASVRETELKCADCAEADRRSEAGDPKGAQKDKSLPGLYNINRFQIRYITKGTLSINQTAFIRTRNKIFMLADLEHTSHYEESPSYNRAEMIIGKSIGNSPWGLVARYQKLSGQDEVYGPGAQFTLTDMPALRDWSARNKVSTFVQLFGFKNDHSIDLLHYYQFPIYRKLYARGVNNLMRFEDRGHYWRWLTDFIYPVSPKFDFYVRFSYQRRNDVFYGTAGPTWALGGRYNFSL